MRILGIDQSLSKCAFCFMVDGEVTHLSLSKTGASKVKNKRPDTNYYDDLHCQIHHICEDLRDHLEGFIPDEIVFESLSFGSVGNASRDLAELMGAMRETIYSSSWDGLISQTAPTALKSYARDFLPEAMQFDGLLKTGKPKKGKMDKRLRVAAVREIYGQDFLKGYNFSSGLDDLADATLLAHKLNSESE